MFYFNSFFNFPTFLSFFVFLALLLLFSSKQALVILPVVRAKKNHPTESQKMVVKLINKSISLPDNGGAHF